MVEPESMDVDHADQPEWKTWIVKSNKAIKDFNDKRNKRPQNKMRINELIRMKDDLEEVLGLLKEKNAKTWNQLHPDAATKENDEGGKRQRPEEVMETKDVLSSIAHFVSGRNSTILHTITTQKQEIPFFSTWSSSWWAVPVVQEKVPLYEELYEACWNGDDDKIRELCLPPPEGTTRKVAPIQIVCKTTEGGKLYLNLVAYRHSHYHL